MAIRAGHSTTRQAETFYEVQRRFRGFALIRARPKTGRTHQIRLHLAHIGCPVLCDRLYGGRAQITLGEIITGREDDHVLLNRQRSTRSASSWSIPKPAKKSNSPRPCPRIWPGSCEPWNSTGRERRGT